MSFISLKLILPPLHEILVDQGEVIALIKPQFEAGKASVGKNGIVRDPAVHQRVLEEILDFAQSNGFNILDLSFHRSRAVKATLIFGSSTESAEW